jgi:hypothetical protein
MATTTISTHIPIKSAPGVSSGTDSTPSSTPHYTAADKIRFVNGLPQKIGGWVSTTLNGVTLSGCVRSIYSATLGEKLQTLLGSDTALYSLVGSELDNLTPLNTSTTAIANSLDTHYATLANDPITTTISSTSVVIADTEASLFKEGDSYILSGAAAVGGIGAGEFNTTHLVRSVGVNEITIETTSAATSSVTGGGAVVVRTSGLITVNATAHSQTDDQRTKIAGATDFGGITAATEMNLEFIVRNAQTNTFDVMTEGTATSSVSGGGGASTTYQTQLSSGQCDEANGQGYGMGRYGVGLYGTALVSSTGRRLPRIWSFDQFGDLIVMSPGNDGGVYSWDGSGTTAPALVSNAPAQVTYVFVSDNILVTLGADGERNKIKSSDINDITAWTASSVNQVFEDYIEGAGRLKTHVSLNGTNLIFTDTQCYTFRYIGLPFIWEIKFKDNIGCASQMSRVVVKGVAYWMGANNFYMWRGGNVEVMPSNTGSETTLLNYVFMDVNRSQLSKSFAWYNKRYDEIWFHYPSEGSAEVDRVARYSVTNRDWVPDTFDRLAAEYPNDNLQVPRLVDSSGNLYKHEVGVDADTSAMAWSLTTNLQDMGTDNVRQGSIIPDSVQTGSISTTINAYSYPQSATAKNTQTITITPTTEFVPLNMDGRFLQYTFSGEELGQDWIMGQWLTSMQKSSRSY